MILVYGLAGDDDKELSKIDGTPYQLRLRQWDAISKKVEWGLRYESGNVRSRSFNNTFVCTALTGPAKGLQPDFNYKEKLRYRFRDHLMEAWEYLPSGFFPEIELYEETKNLNVCSLDDLQETDECDY